jgi:hypothetical protein
MSSPRRRAPKKAYRSVPAGVPPVAPRRGVNSQKAAADKSARKRARRTGTVRRAFAALRTAAFLALLAAALGGGGLLAWRAFDSAGFLALREIAVEGNRVWDRKAILKTAGLELGLKLPLIPARKVEAALRGLPGVAAAEVRREWPSRLVIRVTEQQPVACGYSRGWKGLAPDGSLLPGLPGDAADLPVIDGFASLGEARRAELGAFLEAARRDYPSLYAGFSQLSVINRPQRPQRAGAGAAPAEVEIVLRDGRLKVLADLGNKSLTSLEFLQALLRREAAALEAGSSVDLRVEGYAYVR